MAGTVFLELLARDAAPVEFEGPLVAARAAGADAEEIAELERAKALALQVRAVLEARRRRETELSALYETASDLAALTGIDAVLEAIVRRARQLLHSDVAYLSLNDDELGDTYMRVTDGILSESFRTLRLPMGAGLGGLVAQTAKPYATPDYFRDERFRHTGSIDGAVGEEELTAIIGVPLLIGQQVRGVLYAANRTPRPFSREEVALLISLAAHAAIAIDNARLLSETQSALGELKSASEQLKAHHDSVERAADAHDRLSRIVLDGGGVDDVVREVREVLGGDVAVVDTAGSVLASTVPEDPPSAEEMRLARQALERHRTVEGNGICATPVAAASDQIGAIIVRRPDRLADGDRVADADQRIVERAAMVTSLLLLFRRSVAEAEGRVRGELLEDLLSGVDRDPETLRERARLLDADLDQKHAVVVAELVGDRARVVQATAHVAAVNGGFAAVRRGQLVVILPRRTPQEAASLVDDALRTAGRRPATSGAAGPAAGQEEIVAAYQEAVRCLEALLALGRRGESATSADLGFVGLLLGSGGGSEEFVHSTIGPVVDYDAERRTKLVDTLAAYFRTGGNLSRTSVELRVHVNTVTQRLERVGRLLGSDWQEPERLLEVQMALRLHKLLR